MSQTVSFSIRKECPPGACDCGRDRLLSEPDGDVRILMLTREEEKKLVARIEGITTHADLLEIVKRMQAQLGVSLQITPGIHEVRSARGLNIQLTERPGLCRKTRQAVPAAVRRCLEKNPEIIYAILNERDLLA